MKSVFKYALAATALVGFMSACGGNDEPSNPVNPDKPATPTDPAASTSLIYEANPLFFASDNSLAAIQARLDKIDDLEADVLWLMPIYAQGQKNAIGSPYCVKDYKAINPKYGDMAALKNLVNAAHADGMIVILDWVANHTAWDNVWISEHPDWFTKNANGDIVSPPGMGWNDVADLNYDNVEMRRAMIDAMLYWVKQADVDGFRCDYAEGVPNSFWKEAIRSIREVKPKAFMLAEASDFKLYDADFDMIYDWTYCTDLQNFYNGKSTFDKLSRNPQPRQDRARRQAAAALCREPRRDFRKIAPTDVWQPRGHARRFRNHIVPLAGAHDLLRHGSRLRQPHRLHQRQAPHMECRASKEI